MQAYDLGSGTRVLVTSFHLPNGDGVSIYLDVVDEQHRFSDGGDTLRYLRQRPLKMTEERRSSVAAIASVNGVVLIEDALVVEANVEMSGAAIACLVQAIMQVAALHFDPDGADLSPFVAAVERAIQRFVEPVRTVERRWHHPTRDAEGLFPVDYHLNGKFPARNIFVVTGSSRASRVLNALLFLKSEGIADRSLVLIDLTTELQRSPLKRLQVASDEIVFGRESDDEKVGERLTSFATGID